MMYTPESKDEVKYCTKNKLPIKRRNNYYS